MRYQLSLLQAWMKKQYHMHEQELTSYDAGEGTAPRVSFLTCSSPVCK